MERILLPQSVITSSLTQHQLDDSVNMLAQLLPVNGGQTVTLRQPVTVVGRSPRLCDLPLDNTSVSKLHCILVKTDGLVYMRDLGSTNGTRVNGQRVLRGALLPGDQISFSGSAFRVHLAPDPDNAAEESNGDLSEHGTAIVREEANEDNASGTRSNVRPISDEDLIPED